MRSCGPSAASPVEMYRLRVWGGTPNCVSGVKFLEAFNTGRMQVSAENVICIGGGDTSIDVVSVPADWAGSRTLLTSSGRETVIGGYAAQIRPWRQPGRAPVSR
ncbi:MAG: hypothetical protein Ct9H300mP16_13590 [Pseudomonadota bacterium]|nr:MAG: hypothetical protein Ct9H300mP16_13590 [Pseudomonadota bacterium]